MYDFLLNKTLESFSLHRDGILITRTVWSYQHANFDRVDVRNFQAEFHAKLEFTLHWANHVDVLNVPKTDWKSA